MKPHLRKINGVWHCGYRGITTTQRLGLGYDVFQAYVDWALIK